MVTIGEVFPDWCGIPECSVHETTPCAHFGEMAVCLDQCLVKLMERNSFRVSSDEDEIELVEAIEYVTKNPLNRLLPLGCGECPFSLAEVNSGTRRENVVQCQLLGREVEKDTPECEWPDWQDQIGKEAGLVE